jgi:apolipoprotein N-acyltransferase
VGQLLCDRRLALLAYLALALSALAAPFHERGALFGVGAAALSLLFIGIHNAWDTVAYYVFVQMKKD